MEEVKYVGQVETHCVRRLIELSRLSAEAKTVSEVINYDTRAHEIAQLYGWMAGLDTSNLLKGYNIRRDSIKDGKLAACELTPWRLYTCCDDDPQTPVNFGEDYECYAAYAQAKDLAVGYGFPFRITGPGNYTEEGCL